MSAGAKLKSWLRDQKDNTLSFVLEKLLRKRLERYGQLLELKLDTQAATAVASVLLNGEREPVTVWVDEYQLISAPGGFSVAVTRARASREWITRLLEDFLLGKPLPIPDKYAGYVKRIL